MLGACEADIPRGSEAAARLIALACAAAGATGARAGTTRCWLDHGAVVAAAAFGDIAGDFIIDLSRPATALHVTRANADGITDPSARAPFALAGQRIPALEVAVVDLDAETRPFDTVINGVVGWDVLRRYDIALDLRRGGCRLTLGQPGAAVGRRGARLPLTEIGGVPAITAAVSDGLTARAGSFLIDTARQAVRVRGARLSRPAEGKDKAAPIRLRAVSVAGALFEQLPADVMDDGPPGAAGAVGTAIWRGGWLQLDPSRGRARVLLAPPTAAPPGEIGRLPSRLQWPTLRQMER